MKIRNRLNPSNPCFSFEFFPPKTDEGVTNLMATLQDLVPLDPGFVSVTYGAGGSTRDRTIDLVTQIKRTTGIEAMAHLTCVGHTREELSEILNRLRDEKLEKWPRTESAIRRHLHDYYAVITGLDPLLKNNKISTVLIIDNSYSMEAGGPANSNFQQAKEAAKSEKPVSSDPADEYRTRLDQRRAALARWTRVDARVAYARLTLFALGVVLAVIAFRGLVSAWTLLIPAVALGVLVVLGIARAECHLPMVAEAVVDLTEYRARVRIEIRAGILQDAIRIRRAERG